MGGDRVADWSPKDVSGSNTPGSVWRWIPTLYFGQGIPYVAVMTLSVILYKNLGISNTDIALYTSWLYLPFVIKPLWSPFVDMFRSKRWWIVWLELLIGSAFALVALTHNARRIAWEEQALAPLREEGELDMDPEHAADLLRAIPDYAARFAAQFSAFIPPGETPRD